MLRRIECLLSFKNRPVRTRDLKGGLKRPPPPPDTNRGSQEPATNRVNPRPAGPLDFPPPAGGGGRLNAPPMISVLIAVEKNKRQRSKAREKSFRNHFGHFLSQVKIEASRGPNSKNFQSGFSTIKSLILKVEQRFWYHRVCLVEARRTIYKITLQGQGQSLTSGQVRPRSRDDQNGSYCISVDLPGQDERTDANPTSLSLVDQKLLANDG